MARVKTSTKKPGRGRKYFAPRDPIYRFNPRDPRMNPPTFGRRAVPGQPNISQLVPTRRSQRIHTQVAPTQTRRSQRGSSQLDRLEATQPDVTQPGAAQPADDRPGNSQAAVTQPGADHPDQPEVTQTGVANNPHDDQPVIIQHDGTQPGAAQPRPPGIIQPSVNQARARGNNNTVTEASRLFKGVNYAKRGAKIIRGKTWTEEDDQTILRLHAEGWEWEDITPQLTTVHSPSACSQRYKRLRLMMVELADGTMMTAGEAAESGQLGQGN